MANKLTRKVQLGFLFSVGLVILAVTAVRLPRTFQNSSSETNRITWTTGEFLAATFVANAPTLYSFRQRFRQKKPRERQFSRSGPHIRAVDLNGTTLTELADDASDTRTSNDEESGVTPMAENSRPEMPGRQISLTRMLFSSSTSKTVGWGRADGAVLAPMEQK